MEHKQVVVFCAHFAGVALLLLLSFVILPKSFSYYCIWCAGFLLYVLLATVSYNLSRNLFLTEKIPPHNKAVLITGCDSGFGNMLAKRLDSRGFQVFATCLFPQGEGALNLKLTCSDRLHVLYMDVTKQESVEKALSSVKLNLGNNVLWGIVNNAGISQGFTLDFTSIGDIKNTMEVNAFGQVRVTKVFLPLLKKSRGRVVNVTSLEGRLSKTGECAYVMSKRAAIGFTECLNQDLHVWGIRAISIEPELFRTALSCETNVAKILDSQFKSVDEDTLASYGQEYLSKTKKFALMLSRAGSLNAEPVINDIELALTEKYPKHVYKPRRNVFTSLLWSFLEYIPYSVYEKWVFLMLKLLAFPVPKDVENVTLSTANIN